MRIWCERRGKLIVCFMEQFDDLVIWKERCQIKVYFVDYRDL